MSTANFVANSRNSETSRQGTVPLPPLLQRKMSNRTLRQFHEMVKEDANCVVGDCTWHVRAKAREEADDARPTQLLDLLDQRDTFVETHPGRPRYNSREQSLLCVATYLARCTEAWYGRGFDSPFPSRL